MSPLPPLSSVSLLPPLSPLSRLSRLSTLSQLSTLSLNLRNRWNQIGMGGLVALCQYNNETIFTLALDSVSSELLNSKLSLNFRLEGQNLNVFDVSRQQALHSQLVESLGSDEERTSCSVLSCEYKYYKDDELAKISRHRSYFGIRIDACDVKFLKPTVIDMQCYIRKYMLTSIDSQVDSADLDNLLFIPRYSADRGYLERNYLALSKCAQLAQKGQEQAGSAEGRGEPAAQLFDLLKFELLIVNSRVVAYRNSISEEALCLTFKKLCMWNTGRWGEAPGDLYDYGLLSYERGCSGPGAGDSFYAEVINSPRRF